MVGRERAQAHQRAGHGQLVREAEVAELLRGLGVDHAAAAVDHRPARVGERLRGQPDLLGVALRGGLVAGQVHLGRPARRGCRRARGPAARRPAPGPGRPLEAMWNASWIAFGMSRGSWIRIECLTIGIVMPEMSASWKPSVPIRSVRTWPVRKTVGHAVHHRVGDRGDEVGRAGPAGGERHADRARRLRVALGGVAGALLVAALHVADAGVVERVVGRAGWRRPGSRIRARRPRP